MEPFGWQTQLKTRKLSRSGLFGGLIACSLLAHGLLLGLPWPEAEVITETVEPPPPDPESVIDVAMLPSGTLPRANDEEATLAEASPNSKALAPDLDTSAATDPPPAESTAPPPPKPDQMPSPLPTPEQPPNPTDELPPESGSSELSDPESVTPPTLEERLRDVTAYEHDGTKNLGVGAVTEAQKWVAPGQSAPSKADTLELPYELGETCLDNPPMWGMLVVVVDEVGNFMRGPEVISSTGYAVLDEYAEEFVRTGQYRLPDEGGPKAYSVGVEVMYPDTCP